MLLRHRLTKSVASVTGSVCLGCIVVFGRIISLSAGKPHLIPLVLLLFPVALLSGLFGLLLYPVAAIAGDVVRQREGSYAVIDTEGIRLTDWQHVLRRVLPWAEIKEFQTVFTPPFYTLRAILHSDEIVRVDFIDFDKLERELEKRSIPLQGRERAIFEPSGIAID